MAASGMTPVLSLLESGEAVYETRSYLRWTFRWAAAITAWTAATLLLLFLADRLEPGVRGPIRTAWELVTIFGGLLLAVLGPYALYALWKSLAQTEDFLHHFRPLWHKLRFEMLPSKGDTLDQRLLDKVRQVYPVLRKAPGASFDTEVAGATGSHRFAVFARAGGYLAAVRRYEGAGPVSAMELEKLKEDALDVRKKVGGRYAVLVAASKAGFDASAVQWAQKRRGLAAEGYAITLIQAAGDRLSVVWAG